MATSTEDLPKGWKKFATENGTPYFHNEETGTTQWDLPTADSATGESGNNRSFMNSNKNLSMMGDEFMAGITNLFGGETPPASGPTMEGNLKGSEQTPPKGLMARMVGLHQYFRLSGDELKIRLMSVFTMMQGLFHAEGGHVIQAQLYSEKPDLYACIWVNILGAVLLGFLPNLCNIIFSQKKSDFLEYQAAAFIFAFFPAGAIASYVGGYFAHKRQGSGQFAMGAIDDASDDYLSLPTLMCLAGYVPVPLVVIMPIIMINSSLFRFLMVCGSCGVALAFLYLVVKGHNESAIAIPAPRKIQLMVFGTLTVLAYTSVLMKLPTMAPPTDLSVTIADSIDALAIDSLAKQVKEKVAAGEDSAEALKEVLAAGEAAGAKLDESVDKILEEANVVDMEEDEVKREKVDR